MSRENKGGKCSPTKNRAGMGNVKMKGWGLTPPLKVHGSISDSVLLAEGNLVRILLRRIWEGGAE